MTTTKHGRGIRMRPCLTDGAVSPYGPKPWRVSTGPAALVITGPLTPLLSVSLPVRPDSTAVRFRRAPGFYSLVSPVRRGSDDLLRRRGCCIHGGCYGC